MRSTMKIQDEIIQEVETTREKIAERHGYDARKIAAYLRERAAKQRETEVEDEPASRLLGSAT